MSLTQSFVTHELNPKLSLLSESASQKRWARNIHR